MLFPKDDIQSNFFLQLIAEVKQNLFRIVYLVMKQDESPSIVVLLLSLIQLFQILYFDFSGKLRYLWDNNGVADGIFTFLKYFSIAIHLVDTDFNTVLLVLYFGFGLIVLCILLMILISLTTQSKNSLGLPIIVLRFLIKFFLTIGFMPLMGLFFLILTCSEDVYGNMIMTYIPTQQCWVQDYTIHAIVAILSIILLQGITSIVALIYYESKNVPGDYYAQRNGRPYAFYHFFITISTMVYILLDVPRFTSVILIILLCGSFILFYRIHKERPFYQILTQKVWSIISAINLWTIMLLVFASLLEGSFFRDTIVGWLVGSPLIILIVIRQPEPEIDLLAANINQATSGDQLIKLCEYMLRLIDISGNDQNASLMLDGYIEIHKQTCPKADCVLKVKKQLQEKFRNNPAYRDRNQTLIEIINQIYFYGIKAFPQDVYLRLNYAFFLIDRMKLKQQALAELQQAEQSGPGFDHEFIIYRYKKIIEDDLQEQQQENANQLDIVTELAFQNQTKILTTNVEKSALLHLEFWTQLQEEIPDIGRLSDIGLKIIAMSSQIEDQWNRMKRINQKAIKLNRLIGKFYQSVLNDDEQGFKLLKMAKNHQSQQSRIENLEEISNEPLATIVILTEIEKMGIIQNVNKAACSLIGYTKTDLINRKLNVIQPDIFAKFHDELIEQYLEKSEKAIEQSQNQRDRQIFVKSKSNYIIPCFFNVRMLQTFNSGMYLCSQIRQEVHHRPTCYLICDCNGIIENLSSTCIKLLGIELRQIQLKPLNIIDLFPELINRLDEYKIKGGLPLTYSPINKTQNFTSVIDFDDHFQCDQLLFQCSIIDIVFRNLQSEALASKAFGFIAKFERIVAYDKSLLDFKKRNANPYQFKFNFTKKQYLLEVNSTIDSVQDYKIDQSILWEDVSKVTQLNEPIVQQLNASKQQNIDNNYAEGIKTMRYWNGKITEIDELRSEDEDDMEELNIQQNLAIQQSQQNQDEEAEQENSNQFKTYSQLDLIIKQSKIPSFIKNYKRIIDLIAIILTALAYTQYFLSQQQITKLRTALPYVSQSNQRLSTFILIQGIIQDIEFLNYNYLPYYQETTNNGFYNIQKTSLNQEILVATELQKTLTLAEVNLNSQYNILETAFSSQIVPMQSYDNTSSNYTYNEALQQLIAKALQLNVTDITNFNEQNSDLYFYQYNSFNSLINYFSLAQLYYYYNGISLTETTNDTIIGFLSGASAVLFILILFLGLYLLHLKALNESVLILFLDISEKSIKRIYNKCETFITNLQIGEEDEVQSDDERDENNEYDTDPTLIARKKRRKYKDSRVSYRNFFISLVCLLLIFESYFVTLFVTTNDFISQIFKMTPILNLTSFVECYYRFSDNTLRQYLLNPDYIIGGENSTILLNTLLGNLYQLDAEIHKLHSENLNILEPSYLEAFNQIFILSPCTLLMSKLNFTECETWNNGVLAQGLSIALTQYFENIRLIYYNYQSYINGSNSIDGDTLNYDISSDARLNYAMNQLNSDNGLALRRMSKSILQICYKYLVDQLEISINDRFDQMITIRMAFFVSFNCFLFIIFFLIWLPLHLKMCKGTLKTRLMLRIVPVNVILSVRSIRHYIKKFIIH